MSEKSKDMKHKYQKDLISVKKKMGDIQMKYPIPLDARLRRDVIAYYELINKLIELEVNIDYCNSDDPDNMCSDCNCWKRTRANCG